MTKEQASEALTEAQRKRTLATNLGRPDPTTVDLARNTLLNADLAAHLNGLSATDRWRSKLKGQKSGFILPKP